MSETYSPDVLLMRIPGRLHHRVVSHITIDDGRTLLCGRSIRDMELDDCDFDANLATYGQAIWLQGGTVVIHAICLRCLRILSTSETTPAARTGGAS